MAVAVWKEVGEKRTTLLAGLVVVLVLLSACGTSSAPGELVTEADDVLGTWHRTKRFRQHSQTYVQLRADGTVGFSRAPDQWDYE